MIQSWAFHLLLGAAIYFRAALWNKENIITQPAVMLVAVQQRLLMIHERHASPYVALLCQQRKRIWWKCPLSAIHHAHKWGIQPWKPQLTCCMLGSNAPTLHPRPSDVKSNFQKGHMQLISHYFLNEGDCWLVALIGTLVSYYWRPYVPKGGSFLDKGWKTKVKEKKKEKWPERKSRDKR